MGSLEAAIPWSITLSLSVAAVLVAKFLHEATHAAVARVLGARVVAIDWMDCNVTYRLSAPAWKHSLVGLAPVGLGVMVAWLRWPDLVDGWSGILAAVLSVGELAGVVTVGTSYQYDMLNVALFLGWFWYTCRGGIEDFRWPALYIAQRLGITYPMER